VGVVNDVAADATEEDFSPGFAAAPARYHSISAPFASELADQRPGMTDSTSHFDCNTAIASRLAEFLQPLASFTDFLGKLLLAFGTEGSGEIDFGFQFVERGEALATVPFDRMKGKQATLVGGGEVEGHLENVAVFKNGAGVSSEDEVRRAIAIASTNHFSAKYSIVHDLSHLNKAPSR